MTTLTIETIKKAAKENGVTTMKQITAMQAACAQIGTQEAMKALDWLCAVKVDMVDALMQC